MMVRPAQRRQLLDLAAHQRLREPVGVVEDRGGVVAAQVAGGQQMPRRHRPEITTAVATVVFAQQHVHALAARGRDVLADIVGAQRQFAVAAVDQHRQLHHPRPAHVAQRVQRGAHRAPGVQHVVDEDHQRVVDTAGRNRGGLQRPRRLAASDRRGRA